MTASPSKRRGCHGRVLPGNSRARNRSRSRQRRNEKAPTKLQFLLDVMIGGCS